MPPLTFELWADRKGARLAIVSPDGRRFEGPLPRGYLTKPAITFHLDGEPSFHLVGNRRIAPNRHILSAPDHGRIATFSTPLVTSPFDTRDRSITAPDGSELATLAPAAEGRWKAVRAAFGNDYRLTLGDEQIGWVDRTGKPASQAPAISYRPTRRLSLDARLDPRVAAGLLVYVAVVLDPSKTPG